MTISLNGIKSTGMHPKAQRPAKWRRGGCDKEITETSGGLLGERISWIRVKVRAQHVRRNFPPCSFGYLKHSLGWNTVADKLSDRFARYPKRDGCGSECREEVENFHV